MTLYFIILIFSILLCFVDYFSIQRLLKAELLLFIGVIFLLFAGLRWETGTDWENYYNNFYNISGFEVGGSGFEYLYEWTVRIVYSLFGNYQFMLIVTAAIIIIPTYLTIHRFSPYPIISIFLLYTYSLNSSGFGYRQDIAIAFTFFSFIFIYKRKLLLFLLCIFLAVLFHQSAVIFIPSYWIYKITWNKRNVFLLLLTSVVLYIIFSKMKDIAVLYNASAAQKVEEYSDMDFDDSTFGAGNPYMVIFRGLINRAFILLIPLFAIFTNKMNNEVQLSRGVYNIFLIGALLYVVVSPFGVVFLRFSRYFDIFQILLIPISIYLFKPKFRNLILFLVIIYGSFKFTMSIVNDVETYVPYKISLSL